MRKLMLMILAAITVNAKAQSNETEWNDWLMPGLGYKVYVPRAMDELGIYHGAQPEFVIYAQARNGSSRWGGPSRVKVYTNLSILNSTSAEAADMLSSNIGVNLSFEGKANRNFAIPYFGIETGGLFKKGYSSMHFTPSVGMQVVSTKRIIFSVQGGYQYTIKEFDAYSGYNTMATLNVLLWEK